MSRDLFKSGLKLPERVYIVAPGYDGRAHYSRISKRECVIAVNRGIEAFPTARFWLCSDARLIDEDWFRGVDRNGITTVFSELLDEWDGLSANYTFDPGPVMNIHDFKPKYGCLRMGATVSAQALQFAYWFFAKHITLCGVDMCGSMYFDGTLGDYKDEREEHWPGINRFGLLVEYIKLQEVTVDSLSPTALALEVFDG